MITESSLFLTTIQKFDSNKSADIFGISAKILKLAGPSLIQILTLIFNKCIQGCIRTSLKKAVRIMSFKPRQEHSAPENSTT